MNIVYTLFSAEIGYGVRLFSTPANALKALLKKRGGWTLDAVLLGHDREQNHNDLIVIKEGKVKRTKMFVEQTPPKETFRITFGVVGGRFVEELLPLLVRSEVIYAQFCWKKDANSERDHLSKVVLE